MIRRCHYCGHELPEIRHGARLTPLKARIYDLVQRGGPDGIMRSDLIDIVGEEVFSHQTLKAHIHQINEVIEESGYRIVVGRGMILGGVVRLVSIANRKREVQRRKLNHKKVAR